MRLPAALLIDFGSTYTKLRAIDLDAAASSVPARARRRSPRDIMIGMKAALADLERRLGALAPVQISARVEQRRRRAAHGDRRPGARAHRRGGAPRCARRRRQAGRHVRLPAHRSRHRAHRRARARHPAARRRHRRRQQRRDPAQRRRARPERARVPCRARRQPRRGRRSASRCSRRRSHGVRPKRDAGIQRARHRAGARGDPAAYSSIASCMRRVSTARRRSSTTC